MIITISGDKGGVGRTMTEIHLAAYWAQKDLKVVLVDGDPNRSALKWSERNKGSGLGFDVIYRDEQAVYLTDRRPLPDRIIVDTQAKPDPDDVQVLASRTSLLIVPIKPEALSMSTLPDFIKGWMRAGARRPYRILIADMPPKPATDGPDAIAYLQRLNIPVFSRGIRRYSAFTKAAMVGATVRDVPGGEAGWDDYQAMGEECDRILGTTAGPAATLAVASEQR